MPFKFFKRSPVEEDADMSIIDAMDRLNNEPVPYLGDFTVQHTGTIPIIRPVNPPSRQDRPELHITPPAGQQVTRPPRPSRGHVLIMSRATLPLFHETAHQLGWRAFIPPPRPRITWARAIQGIAVYSDKTYRVVCSEVEAARGELWERARDYDMREAEFRARRPLTSQKGM
jgi:hypothetical protein